MASFDRAKHHGRPENLLEAQEACNSQQNEASWIKAEWDATDTERQRLIQENDKLSEELSRLHSTLSSVQSSTVILEIGNEKNHL